MSPLFFMSTYDPPSTSHLCIHRVPCIRNSSFSFRVPCTPLYGSPLAFHLALLYPYPPLLPHPSPPSFRLSPLTLTFRHRGSHIHFLLICSPLPLFLRFSFFVVPNLERPTDISPTVVPALLFMFSFSGVRELTHTVRHCIRTVPYRFRFFFFSVHHLSIPFALTLNSPSFV